MQKLTIQLSVFSAVVILTILTLIMPLSAQQTGAGDTTPLEEEYHLPLMKMRYALFIGAAQFACVAKGMSLSQADIDLILLAIYLDDDEPGMHAASKRILAFMEAENGCALIQKMLMEYVTSILDKTNKAYTEFLKKGLG